MRVAVLGCGPAGLLAAWAARQRSHQVKIFSHVQPSVIGGAQFLHIPINNITDHYPEGHVEFIRNGTAEGYAQKVYGHPDAPTSWYTYEGLVPVWNMRTAYERLWDRLSQYMEEAEITPRYASGLTIDFDRVLSCVPAPAVCPHDGRCYFDSQEVWIAPAQPKEIMEMSVIYSGLPGHEWYRASNLFGHASREFSHDPGKEGLIKIKKPLQTNCSGPKIPTFFRMGRYGQWKKGILIHNAYEDTHKVLDNAM
jgi:hypothetical protein